MRKKRERLIERCRLLMAAGGWWTIVAMAAELGCTQTGASARIRDQRKVKFGAHKIVKRAIPGGLYEYRMESKRRRLRHGADAD